MAIGPVQLIVLGFITPDFHGEVIAELERLRESDTVRVIDALAVYKDADGELEVEHLSNLTPGRGDRARQQDRRADRPRHRGRGGHGGGRPGRRRGGRRAASTLLRRGGVGCARGHPRTIPRPRSSCWSTTGRYRCGTRSPARAASDQRRLHQPARPRRDRPGHGRGSRRTARDGDRRGRSGGPRDRTDHDRRYAMFGSRRVARRTGGAPPGASPAARRRPMSPAAAAGRRRRRARRACADRARVGPAKLPARAPGGPLRCPRSSARRRPRRRSRSPARASAPR